jgi:hypothetical protein
MKINHILALAVSNLFIVPVIARAQFASSVSSYTQGSGANPAVNNPNTALGAPTVFIGYQNADPLNPPYASSDIVGLGTNGAITLQFNAPILNTPHPFGLDFIVFGHAGFNITNGNYSGGGITDGSLFTGGTSQIRVSVSVDGSTFYTLNPALTPQVDDLFPTDASGNPFLPVNPSLTAGDFAGKNLAGIRSLYNGSAGGAGFNLDWAVNNLNQSVSLPAVNYVRLEELNGIAYIDAVSVVPEPATCVLAFTGAGLLWLQRRKK